MRCSSSRGANRATVELEEIVRCWSKAIDGSRTAFAYRNLAALWSTFVVAGASWLLLSTLVERRSDWHLVSEAVSGARITVARLEAPLSALEQRIRLREPTAPEDDLDGARWWTRHLDEERLEEHVVQTENRPVREHAREVLRLVDWLP